MKTIGTLEEIGAQVGDVVEYQHGGIPGGHRIVASDKPNDNGWWVDADGDEMAQNSPYWRIVRDAGSPVRTVTRKEIVPGIYGRICIDKSEDTEKVALCFTGQYAPTGVSVLTASDLTAAIKTLTEIRDAMQDNT